MRIDLRDGWQLQSSARVDQAGAAISTPEFHPQNWVPISVPATVIAGLLQNGVYPDPFFGRNLDLIQAGDFDLPWWYRKEFTLPAGQNGRIWLNFEGINYRANVWLNGAQIADSEQVVGPFRQYEMDVTDQVRPAPEVNVLAVEAYRPKPDDLAITFVDWNPPPPDGNMGLPNDVFLRISGPVTVRHPLVITNLDLPSLDVAHLTVVAEVRNGTAGDVVGTLQGSIGDVEFAQDVWLAAQESKHVVFDPKVYPQLNLTHPRIWWPWQYGKQEMYDLSLRFTIGDQVSDQMTAPFGIRQITSELDASSHIVFQVNGKRILIRGAAWNPDMFQRRSPERQEAEFRYVRDMNLNAIRLEGKFEDDHFFDLADRYGILILEGWCCCDAWQYPEKWNEEQHMIARESLRSQILRLRIHPSMLVWMNGSDAPPSVQAVERAYLDILTDLQWPNPVLSSASQQPSRVTGESGVKMLGPYEWVPPIYWETDTESGGAWGFATEISPGPAVPPLESLQTMLPPEHLWPIDDDWIYHAGGGEFHSLEVFDNALNARLGPAESAADYAEKAQAMAYESHRAMFEAYGRNKYGSSGVIQWMLNNAWPSMIWHLYDNYLRPGGSYFGAKKALEPLHIQYSYKDQAIVVVNSYEQAYASLRASADVYGLDGTNLYHDQASVSVDPDGVTPAFTLPSIAGLPTTYLLRLTLSDDSNQVLSVNTYWLSTVPDVLNWRRTEWYYTPVSSYADLTGLQSLPPLSLTVAGRTERHDAEQVHVVTVANPGPAIAFFVHLKIRRGAGGDELLPIRWEDNYFTLLPGESREVRAIYLAADLGDAAPVVEVDVWNNIER